MKLLHCAFIAVFPVKRHHKSLTDASMSLKSNIVNSNIDGLKYFLLGNDIGMHPGPFFQKILCKGRDAAAASATTLFKLTNAFLTSSQMSSDTIDVSCAALEDEVFHKLGNEATYVKLSSLSAGCDALRPSSALPGALQRLQLPEEGSLSAMVLQQAWRPLAITGSICSRLQRYSLLKNTTASSVDVEQLISLAKQIPQRNAGRNSSVLEIKPCLLSTSNVHSIGNEIDVTKLFADMENVHLRARKLVIRTAGDMQDPTIDATDEKDCLGFMEVVLNAAFTGGEIHVSENGQNTTVNNGPFSCVAVPAGVDCAIHPVTSGARVSLVFGIYGEPASDSQSFSSGKSELSGWGHLLESRLNPYEHEASALDHIINTAQYLDPGQNTAGAKKFEIKAYFLSQHYLPFIIRGGREMNCKMGNLFPFLELEYRCTKLQVRTADPSGPADVEVVRSDGDKKYGYLGTVVMINPGREYAYVGGAVRVTTPDGVITTIDTTHNWYAVAAGGTSTIDAITSGSRFSLQYDIYGVSTSHDPFSQLNSDLPVAEKTHLVTRATVSERVKSAVLSAGEAELATNDALVICLQYVYSGEQQNDPVSSLRGGDRNMYKILTDTNQYYVQPVNNTLHSARDATTGQIRIVSGTYSATNTDLVTSAKLIVPITLSSEHLNVENEDTYTVTGLRVAKKMLG